VTVVGSSAVVKVALTAAATAATDLLLELENII